MGSADYFTSRPGWYALSLLLTTAVWPRSVNMTLAVELSLLVAFLVGWQIAGDRPADIALDILVALSAGAMGIQTAAARRRAVEGVTTTFVTGTLTSLIAGFAALGPDWARSTRWAATLACMVIGAAAGAALFIAWRPGAPLVAMLLVGMVLAAAAWRTRELSPKSTGSTADWVMSETPTHSHAGRTSSIWQGVVHGRQTGGCRQTGGDGKLSRGL